MQPLLRFQIWLAGLLTAARRDERGGVTDETAMIALLLLGAVFVAGAVYTLVTGKAEDLKIELP